MSKEEKAKEKHIIPEHLINVPLSPEREHKVVARVNAIKEWIIEQLSPETKQQARDQIKELEKKCLKELKMKIAEEVRQKPFESRFGTQTSKEEKEDTGKPSSQLL